MIQLFKLRHLVIVNLLDNPHTRTEQDEFDLRGSPSKDNE